MHNRNSHGRPGGGNFSYNYYVGSECTQTGYPQPFNNQMGLEPSFQGPANYGWHQLPPTHQRPGYPGSQWNHNHDFNHAVHPYPSNYSISFEQHFEKPWHYGPRQENPRPNFNMRNNQYNPTQSNNYSNQLIPFNNGNVGRGFKLATKQYGGEGQYETQEYLPCQDGKMSLATTDQPTIPPSYIAANNWQQVGTAEDEVMEVSSSMPVKWRKVHKQTMALMEGMNQPVEADKALRIMAMMGWRGGALGCNRGGLTEPLMPNLLHVNHNGAGLGHEQLHSRVQRKIQRLLNTHRMPKSENKLLTPKQKKPGHVMVARRPKAKSMRRRLPPARQTEILNKILGFVSDPKQRKLVFDKTITNQQRAYIHFFSEAVEVSGGVLYDGVLDDAQQKNIIAEICERNSYLLYTETEGVGVDPQIIMYKQAPVHMYLITSDDIDDENDDDETDDETDYEDFEKGGGIAIFYNYLDDDDNQLESAELGDDEICNANDDNTDKNITEDKVTVKIEPSHEMDNIELDPNTEESDNDENITEDKVTVKIEPSHEMDNIEFDPNTEERDNDENITEDKVTVKIEPSHEMDNIELDPNTEERDNDENITEDKVSVKIEPSHGIDNIELDPNTEERDNEDKIHPTDIEEIKSDQIKSEINPNDDVVKESIEHASTENEIEHIPIIKTEGQLKIEHEPIQREERIKMLLLKYFKEFSLNTKYTEMRFLGHFDDMEENAIVNFVTEIGKCIDDVSYCKNLTQKDWLAKIFLDTTYKLMTMANTEGCTGIIIEKTLRKDVGEESESIKIQ